MTDSGDNEQLAPRRSLAGPGGAPQQQPAMTPPYAAGPRTYTAADADTGRTFPVPPAAQMSRSATQTAPPESGAGTGMSGRATATAPQRATGSRPRQTRRAKLRLTRVDPWSVTKTAFLLSIAFGIMCVVAVFLVFSILNASGLWEHINSTVQGLINARPGHRFDITTYVAMSRVMGITMLIAAVDVVLITALATLGAFIYNLSSAMLGGIEVTLAEDLK
jgi:Transmembrane domain of unknown function (DUF3566)